MVDIDAAGAVTHGGLMGAAVEKPSGHAGEHAGRCADCGTETIGRFCHNCGNASHVHRTLLHLGEELLHGVMHFDSRAWRTIPRLLFRPGQLTREWCEGKRARYVSPLAMFLFTVFVIFMLLSYLPSKEDEPDVVGRQVVATADLARRQSDVAQARIALREAPPAARAAAELALKAAEAREAEAAARVGQRDNPEEDVKWQAELAEDARSGQLSFSTGIEKLDKKLAEKAKNPELALYKIQQTFYKFSFLLVPISIPFVAVLFLWKRGFTLYDHGVFVLYSLSFMSILILALALLGRVGGVLYGLGIAAATFAVPAHMYYQLQGAYRLRTFSTLWRTFFLLVFSSIALTFFLLAIIWLGFA